MVLALVLVMVLVLVLVRASIGMEFTHGSRACEHPCRHRQDNDQHVAGNQTHQQTCELTCIHASNLASPLQLQPFVNGLGNARMRTVPHAASTAAATCLPAAKWWSCQLGSPPPAAPREDTKHPS